jgi:hypothetical protein
VDFDRNIMSIGRITIPIGGDEPSESVALAKAVTMPPQTKAIVAGTTSASAASVRAFVPNARTEQSVGHGYCVQLYALMTALFQCSWLTPRKLAGRCICRYKPR